MKKIGFILLIMLLPLQSAWAAVQLYHSHESTATLADIVFHNHASAAHGHSHAVSDHDEQELANSDQSDTSDHHHHFHVHTVSVLNNVIEPHFPSPSAVQHSRIPALQDTLFPQRIERPNWR